MAKLKYPIGIQDFYSLRQEGYAYVDKTRYVAELIDGGKYLFLSRPRRFGKSLMLSTIQAYFEGRRELFKGLALDKMDMDWTPRPVLYFDFNNGLYDEEGALTHFLHVALKDYEAIYGLPPQDETRWSIPTRFATLLETVFSRTGQRAVILIDEYDKPLLAIEDNKELFERNQALLKAFYGNLKSKDRYIRFAMLTGVARFNKVSIFSDVNHLKDISMSDRYSDICGWTEPELESMFKEGIESLAKELGQDYEATLSDLRYYYDGYLFTRKGSRLYNPFSVLRAMDDSDIQPYWFATATPTFLVKRVKKSGIDPSFLNGCTARERDLLAVGIGTSTPIPLMFQTGYLTIDSYDARRREYRLRFPNREVETCFSEDLLKMYAPPTDKPDSTFSIQCFRDDLFDGRPDDFMKRLESLFKDLPGEDHHESTYRAITYLMCTVSGTPSQAERHSYRGRSDLEVYTPDYVYLFEFKYNRSVREAMDQIHSRDYAGRLAMDPRTVYLVGANYDEHKNHRELTYEIETMRK